MPCVLAVLLDCRKCLLWQGHIFGGLSRTAFFGERVLMVEPQATSRADPNEDIASILRQEILANEYKDESGRTSHLLMLMAMDSEFDTTHIDSLVKVVHRFAERAKLREESLKKSIEIAKVMRVGLLDREYGEVSSEMIQQYDSQQRSKRSMSDAQRARLLELREQRDLRLRAKQQNDTGSDKGEIGRRSR